MSSAPIRIGVVGAGGIAKIHLARYAKLEEAAIVAVCDPVEAAADAAAKEAGARAFSSVDAMLSSVELDAVDVCTPPAFHEDPILKAIAAGLNVLSEKPLAHSVAAARRIVEAAERQGILLMTGFCHRFHPPVAFLHEQIKSGAMGEIVMFRCRFAGLDESMPDKWFSKKAVAGGGALLDTCVHSIDLFRFLVGEPTRVEAVMRQTNPAITEVEDTAIALLATKDNRMGTVEACWSIPAGYNVVEVFGVHGTAVIHYWDGMASRYKTDAMADWAPLPQTGPDRFAGELQHFIDACLGRVPLSVTGFDGLRAAEIAEAAYRSAGIE